MIKKLFLGTALITSFSGISQSYSPPAGQPGSTAIHKDDNVFVGWATGAEVVRGFLNASDTTFKINGNNRASYGIPSKATGKAEGSSMDVVSLGDGGTATLTFAHPIKNGTGPDFAVFENSFTNDFLELAFVEVSSDGEHFFRFPAHTEVQSVTQISTYGTMDCRYIHNLAGSFIQGYGTPFDLEDLQDDVLLDKNNITHVRIIDVIGSIDPAIGTRDSHGNLVNDPFPTPFESCGFDLDAVGVIHQNILGKEELQLLASVYPNPVEDQLTIELSQPAVIRMYTLTGEKVLETEKGIYFQLDVANKSAGVYLLTISSDKGQKTERIIVK